MLWVHRIIQGIARLSSRNKLPILYYHQVLNNSISSDAKQQAVRDFTAQMEVLKRYYNPIALEEAIVLLAKKKLPANSICVTFDDGYLDNLTIAAPILKTLDIPATVYVASAFTDTGNMWNDDIISLLHDESIVEFDLSALDAGIHRDLDKQMRQRLIGRVQGELKYIPFEQRKAHVDDLLRRHGKAKYPYKMLSSEQIGELADYGVTVAAHTHDHPILAVLPLAQQRQQLEKNIGCLSQWGIETNQIGFAYPNGKLGQDFSVETAVLVQKMGFSYAVTTHHGVCVPHSDQFQLPRIAPWHKRPLRFHLSLMLNILGLK